VPSFGDAGETFDPFTCLGYLIAQNKEIALGVASIALPLASSGSYSKIGCDHRSAFWWKTDFRDSFRRPNRGVFRKGIDFDSRGERFRESFHCLRKAQEKFPVLETKHFGNLSGYLDLLPEPIVQKIPLLITGSSRQSLEWNAQNADGWMNYPRDLYNQMLMIKQWRDLVARNNNFEKPFMQSLYVIL